MHELSVDTHFPRYPVTFSLLHKTHPNLNVHLSTPKHTHTHNFALRLTDPSASSKSFGSCALPLMAPIYIITLIVINSRELVHHFAHSHPNEWGHWNWFRSHCIDGRDQRTANSPKKRGKGEATTNYNYNFSLTFTTRQLKRGERTTNWHTLRAGWLWRYKWLW